MLIILLKKGYFMVNAKALIVIPTYKRPDRIARAVESALKQTYDNTTVVVVDDNGRGTPEQLRTYNVLKEFIVNKEITYIVNEVNCNGSNSRNNGLFSCESDYVTFLDDDDEIFPDKIAKQIAKLEQMGEEYSCCYSSFEKVLENGAVYTSDENVEGDCYGYALSRSIYLGSGSNLLVRTKVAKDIGGYDGTFKKNQDLEFFTRMLDGYKLAYVDEVLFRVHYEIRENKMTYDKIMYAENVYVNRFKNDFKRLGKKKEKAIYRIIACERFRLSLGKGHLLSNIMNMFKNKVGIITLSKYFIYLVDRVVNKKSYGFKLF